MEKDAVQKVHHTDTCKDCYCLYQVLTYSCYPYLVGSSGMPAAPVYLLSPRRPFPQNPTRRIAERSLSVVLIYLASDRNSFPYDDQRNLSHRTGSLSRCQSRRSCLSRRRNLFLRIVIVAHRTSAHSQCYGPSSTAHLNPYRPFSRHLWHIHSHHLHLYHERRTFQHTDLTGVESVVRRGIASRLDAF